MEPWMLFPVLAAFCLLIGLAKPKHLLRGRWTEFAAKGIHMSNSKVHGQEEWGESGITTQLQQLRLEKPDLIPHFAQSLSERFIMRQDDRTAQTRLQFLRTQIEQLKLAKEFQVAFYDLNQLRLEVAKRQKVLEIENDDLLDKQRSRDDLSNLNAKKERKRLELELAQIEQELERTKKGRTGQTGSDEPPDAAARRRRIVKEAEQLDAEMKRHLIELTKGRQYEELLEDEQERYDRIRNTYKDLIDKKYEELERL